jgi:hypothetical protein
MDAILAQMEAVNWNYADKDPAAREVLRTRIQNAAKQTKMLRYSELAEGVEFRLPQIRGGDPYYITTWDWTGLDRKIIGEFLGYLSMESWREGQFMVSALVIGGLEHQPSDQFFAWMKELGVLPNVKKDTVYAFWSEQVKKAFDFYRGRK